jgi:hypothetical protein
MFKKKPEKTIAVTKPMTTEPANPKYQHPKILLIDTIPEIAKTLETEGYNVSSGTFGTPYRVQKGSGYRPVVVNPSLPNYTEQEIVVIDLVPGAPTDEPPGEKMAPEKELDWWAKCSSGVIDPRPRAMAMVQTHFNRILDNGGVFIVFSDAKLHQKISCAYKDYHGLELEQELHYDNWSFLSILSNLSVNPDHGQEISAAKIKWSLVGLLDDHLDGAVFYCTLEAQYRIENRWVVLAKNKYGAAVAGVIGPAEMAKDGWIFILPQIKSKARFLSAFLKNILPDLCPNLFPHAKGQKWVYRPEYEIPSVLEKAKQISDIQDDAAKRVAELEKAIEADRNANLFLYDLIRETGDALVEAVKKALVLLGFKSVIDVDAEMADAGNAAALREDLRIHDKSPILVVDIKGVAGKPADAEALQAQKHAFIYIQDQNRADVRGLTIINHQRLLPPLERDNDMPFRKEILDNAEQVKLGLMTGWDLFRLVRGFIQNKWKHEQVMPLFYQTGRILPIPRHYECVGKVGQVWKSAFSVKIEQGEIRVGDSIAVELSVDFSEQNVTSLKLNNETVEVATANCEVGIQRNPSFPQLKSGMSVYHIKH